MRKNLAGLMVVVSVKKMNPMFRAVIDPIRRDRDPGVRSNEVIDPVNDLILSKISIQVSADPALNLSALRIEAISTGLDRKSVV